MRRFGDERCVCAVGRWGRGIGLTAEVGGLASRPNHALTGVAVGFSAARAQSRDGRSVRGNMLGVARLRAGGGRHARIVVCAAVIGAVAMLIGIVGWRIHEGSRRGRVELVAEGEPMVGQVLEGDSDVAIGEPFDIATRAAVNLPEGDYRLRVNGMGRLGRTFRFVVAGGETHVHTVSIDEGRLLGYETSGRPGAKERETGWKRHLRAAGLGDRACAWAGRLDRGDTRVAHLPRWRDGPSEVEPDRAREIGRRRRPGPGALDLRARSNGRAASGTARARAGLEWRRHG